MSKKVTRRDFAKRSMAAGAAAVAAPAGVFAGEAPRGTTTAASGAAAARRLAASLPTGLSYGGDGTDLRERLMIDPAEYAQQAAPVTINGWREGTTIPAEYYVDERRWMNDERYIADHLWLMADHQSRIPKPGDYFVFEFGRGESAIILRDQSNAIKAFHNVCRHRGSRLCRHDEHRDRKDTRLSVVQLGPTGNTPVFRCPYHAWTYDLTGKLTSFPQGMPPGFNPAENGLVPCHVRTSEGFIFVNFSHGDPPDFDAAVKTFTSTVAEYGTADLKTVARLSAPTLANWKLVLENFQECYHCAPSHKALVKAHPFWSYTHTPAQEAHLMKQLEHVIAAHRAERAARSAAMGAESAPPTGASGGYQLGGAILNANMVSGSLDGKPVAPLLPARKEWTRRYKGASVAWSTGGALCYDDHVIGWRFTPRDVKLTDAELWWMVRADAKEKDVDIARMKPLWEITYREDRWISENNHDGIESSHYRSGHYAAIEPGPQRFVKWYMTEVVSAAAAGNRTAS